jgi:hypothetical protein
MTTAGVVNPQSPASVANARSALGLSATAPLYYSTQGVRAWLQANAPRGARILTDRDDMVLLRGVVIMGPRQVGATTFYTTPEQAELFLETSRAMASRNLHRLIELGRLLGADFIVIPWRADGIAAFADNDFSVIAMRNG